MALRDLQLMLRATLLLPAPVAWFYVRAQMVARWRGDTFSLVAPARPQDLAPLLSLAKGRRYAVELGTGTAWTTVALALADPNRNVVTYDPVTHPGSSWYLKLAGDDARARIELRAEPAGRGPADGDPPVQLLFIDIGGHSRADTVSAFLAWRDSLAPDAIVVFHDYGPGFPGVPMAIAQLGLVGTQVGESLFVCRFPQPADE